MTHGRTSTSRSRRTRSGTSTSLTSSSATTRRTGRAARCRGTAGAKRVETVRFHRFTYDEPIQRDKARLDIFWLREESLEDSDNLPAPEVIAAEIVEDLTAALAEFEAVPSTLESRSQG